MDATTLHGENSLHMTTYILEGVAIWVAHTCGRVPCWMKITPSPLLVGTLKLQVLKHALTPEITFLKYMLKSHFSG
jgi:hypothetical protein